MVVGDVTTAVDVLVIGAGPAGYVSAIRAAQLGRHVTLIESGSVGGVCLQRGCIPLKALLSASERYQQMCQESLAEMGIHAEMVAFDWSRMQAWRQSVVDRLVNGVQRLIAELLEPGELLTGRRMRRGSRLVHRQPEPTVVVWRSTLSGHAPRHPAAPT